MKKISRREVSLAPDENELTEGHIEPFNIFVKWRSDSNRVIDGVTPLLSWPGRASGARTAPLRVPRLGPWAQRLYCPTLTTHLKLILLICLPQGPCERVWLD